MKAKELREKTLSELQKLLSEQRNKLLKLKMEKELGKLKQTHLIKQTRKIIARILTLMKEKWQEKESLAK